MIEKTKNNLSGKELAAAILLMIVIIGASAVAGWRLGYAGMNPFTPRNTRSVADINHVYNLILSEYYMKPDPDKLAGDTIDALVQSLNEPHSFYVRKDIYQKFSA